MVPFIDEFSQAHLSNFYQLVYIHYLNMSFFQSKIHYFLIF